eukprot:6875855-Pyramimonas_sp.AAC.2
MRENTRAVAVDMEVAVPTTQAPTRAKALVGLVGDLVVLGAEVFPSARRTSPAPGCGGEPP